MSLAHLRAPKLERSRVAAAAVVRPERAVAGVTAFCGASREPIYRTVDEASESGLEICDTCLVHSRKQRRSVQ